MKKYSKLMAVLLVVAMLLPGIAQAAPVEKTGVEVTRLGGVDRVGTSILASQEAYKDGADAVVLAGFGGDVDALTGTLLAGAKDAPLLITRKAALSPEVKTEIERLNAKTVYILGGESVVSKEVATALKGYTVKRIAGDNREETAIAVAKEVKGAKATHVFLTLGRMPVETDALADALAIGPVSAMKNMPVLLTGTKAIPAATVKAMKDMGVTHVTIVGGPKAVSADVATELAKDYTVDRVAGDSRENTALAIAADYFATPNNYIVAYGRSSADALVGGYLGAKKNAPILLTNTAGLTEATKAKLAASPLDTYILGGTTVVTKTVEDQVVAALGGKVEEPVETDLVVKSVSAITATEVRVEIAELAEDLVDANVVVKNVGGQVYETKAMDLKAGAKEATFAFVTPLTVTPSEGWTVNGVKYSPADFAIVDVEVLTETAKYLSVQFNKPIKSLDASEVAVRDALTSERKGVEKVTLASDGLSAQVTLLGDDTSGTKILTPKRDYTLSVTQNGVVTSNTFEVPSIIREKDVESYDLTTRVVTMAGAAGMFKVPTATAFDFEELKGRELTAWVDKDGNLIKYVVSPQTVKYSAVKFVQENGKEYVKLMGSDDKYLIADPHRIELNDSSVSVSGSTGIANNTVYDYAKVILDKSGYVDVIIAYNFDATIVAEKVSGTAVVSYGDEVNLKDYKIVKDGKTITINDIKAGDAISYNIAKKYAEVFTLKVTGKIEAVYDGEYKFDGKVQSIAGTKAIVNGKVSVLDQKGIESLKASGNDVTAYYDRKGNVKILVGSVSEEASAKTVEYLTKNARFYQDKGYDFVELKALSSTGTEITETININTLKTINNGDDKPTFEVGKGTPKIDKFELDGSNNIDAKTATGTKIGSSIKSPTDFAKGSIVEVIKNDKGEVTGLNFGKKAATTADAKPTDTKVQISGSVDLQITSSTPVFWVDDKTDPSNVKTSMTTWGALADKKITEVKLGKATVFYNAKTKITEYVLIKASDVEAERETKEATLTIADVRKDTDGNVAYLKLFNGSTVKEYTIEGKIADDSYAVGNVVKATVNKNNELEVSKLVKQAVTSGPIVKNSVLVAEQKFSIISGGAQVDYKKPASGNTQVYEVVGTGANRTLEARSFSALFDIKKTNSVSVYGVTADVANIVVITNNEDTAVVTNATNGTVSLANTKADGSTPLNQGEVRFKTDAVDAGDTIHSVKLTVKKGAAVVATKTIEAPAGRNKWEDTYTFSELLKTAADGTVNLAGSYTVDAVVYEVPGTPANSATQLNLTAIDDKLVAKAASNTVTVENNFGQTTTTVAGQELLDVTTPGSGKAKVAGMDFLSSTATKNYNVAITKVNGVTTDIVGASIKAETTANDGKVKFTVANIVTSFEVKIKVDNPITGNTTVTLEATAANGNITAWTVK